MEDDQFYVDFTFTLTPDIFENLFRVYNSMMSVSPLEAIESCDNRTRVSQELDHELQNLDHEG